MLSSTINTSEVAEDIRAEFQATGYAELLADGDWSWEVVYEHGQWWILAQSGATWSVVDCVVSGEDTFGFEQISDGEED